MAPEQPHGLMGSLRTVFRTLLAILQNRAELFVIELQEEKYRLSSLILWVAAIVLFGLMSLVLLNIMLLILFWEQRVPVIVGLTLFYIFATFLLAFGLRHWLKSSPLPFSATLEELRKDRECFKN